MKTIDLDNYKQISHINLMDAKHKIISILNVVALIGIIACCSIGIALNYFLRMWQQPGGMYLLCCLGGVVLCVIYIYLHELTHAIGIVISTGKKPQIKFGKFVASCGSPNIIFTKSCYFFVCTLPLIFYCVLLIPLCIFLPPLFFPLPFMPLCYNIFGSMGDVYMLRKVMRSPKRCVVIDSGVEIIIYKPPA